MIYTEESFADAMAAELAFAAHVQKDPDYKSHFIINRQADNADEWNLYFEGVAANISFNLFNITYNICTFNGAADIDCKCTLLLNPYYNFALPLPKPPQYKKVVSEVLNMVDGAHDDLESSYLTDENEIIIAKALPNGWSSTTAQTYLNLPVTRPFYRLSAGLPLYKHCLENYSLLHPECERQLTNHELTAILRHDFFDWLETIIAASPVMNEPKFINSDFDISGDEYKPNRCTPVHIIPAFKANGVL